MNKQELIAKIAKDTGSSKAGAAAVLARQVRLPKSPPAH